MGNEGGVVCNYELCVFCESSLEVKCPLDFDVSLRKIEINNPCYKHRISNFTTVSPNLSCSNWSDAVAVTKEKWVDNASRQLLIENLIVKTLCNVVECIHYKRFQVGFTHEKTDNYIKMHLGCRL